MSNVVIDKEALQSFEGVDGPVVMLNLFRLKDKAQFGEFIQVLRSAANEALASASAEVVYAGAMGPEFVAGEDHWDVVLLIRYPDWQIFRDLSANDETFDKTQAIRRQYLDDARFIITTPLGG
jgi:hypothetical protein